MNEFAPQDSPANKPDPSSSSPFPETSYTARTAANDTGKSETSYKWLVKGGLFVLAIAFFFGMKMYNKSSASADVKKEMYAAYADFPDQAQIRTIIDRHHDRCFDECYKTGGRRSSAKFDDERYVNMMNSAIQTELMGVDGLQKLVEVRQAAAEESEIEDPLSAVDPNNQVDRLNDLYEAGSTNEQQNVSPAFELGEEQATKSEDE